MAKLRTIGTLTLASLMVSTLTGNPTKDVLDWQVSEILRLLPSGTKLTKLNEITKPHLGLYREFEMEFDCPFFLQDFEFEVSYTRECLSDGVSPLYQYQQATKITKV